MAVSLQGRKVAVLATDGVEQVELTEPIKALKGAGADVSLVAPKSGRIQAMTADVEMADQFPVDLELMAARPDGFDALLLPGGTTNPDKLRMHPGAVAFVKAFVDGDKPIAAICHGPWTLIEAGGVKGKRMTSWPSLQTDLRNAGALWRDEVCVCDGRLVTSRKPDDLPAFIEQMMVLFAA
ncbi:type 1 glutamine amidotransferase domain-containing protein [Marinivivus vitaminiproducens]|uniref:type 1 glutamine amidotransferase domain-containing protein n=1 Tax=Marinivivus vitaminiproducens TaxID=3035935 RepID=UPI0027A735B5|nr:type 1 glutamine amidotransferase [Geminicoccaceae bacterium SCSIO 64248]